MLSHLARGTALVLLLAVSACAPPPPPPRPVPAPTPAPAPAPMVMPTPPNSAAPDLIIPISDVNGRRLTPNIDLSPDQALWQLRIGLNVAALSCRGPNETVLVGNYTTFLNGNRTEIARSERMVIAELGRRTGTSGIAARDALSTRLYNYFAQPPVIYAFCERATAIMALAAVEPRDTVLTFATQRIVELDQPFVDFYAAYIRYQSDLALWRSRQPVLASPVGPNGPIIGAPVIAVPVPPSTLPPANVTPPRPSGTR